MNASPEYAALQTRFHQERSDYGISGMRYADQIMQLAKSMNTRDILDYGCGKATLQKNIPFPIQNYDPFIEEYNHAPHPAELVVCTDVMEHIEPEFVASVLAEINGLTNKLAFFQIATGPASKVLPDGRNAHLIQQSGNFWLTKLIEAHFSIRQFQDMGKGLIVICTPDTFSQPESVQRG